LFLNNEAFYIFSCDDDGAVIQGPHRALLGGGVVLHVGRASASGAVGLVAQRQAGPALVADRRRRRADHVGHPLGRPG